MSLVNCFEVGKKSIFHFMLFCIPNYIILNLCISKQNNVYINEGYKYKWNISVWCIVFCRYDTVHESNILLKNYYRNIIHKINKNYKALNLNHNPLNNYVELLKHLEINNKNNSN